MNSPIRLVLLAIAACAWFASCRSTSAEDGVPFRTIARGYQSGIVEPGIEIARNEEQWRALWTRHTSTVLPRPEPPPVDFDREMVVCITAGVRPTTGYALEVQRILPEERGLVVEAVERQPARDAILPQLLSQPFHMVTVSRTEDDVQLRTKVQEPSSP